ncbi:hypothetical protein GobsT_08630 [Gemmata obscuriglobus]|uniref:TIGR02996 domain-containing protein n=1 Tax=Gemmata obscuriglobus TaxID=114 RepID=A0A2Z3HGU4_9BACT|nr:TIGR02996 domain-containing protein [Gemmata obscuriglobus]AWM40610.1 TIGR02996 domain-containing protein [Gemmata obscuriglobus]QEG26128.1 hypothetical protein GobsT_08630 [Gemmata obscuriglobus]VTS00667.1 Uncharacterized protein OS=Cystobacter violaceus Cb vi76 GN=Q664_31220 PE=4 SV=1 [Gemmata obscuriglobus UQM 2246]
MSDEAGFLKAIADHPAERATRLAYADWLDEQGRAAEAEFLKVQLQVAELNARLIELGGQAGAEWLASVGNPQAEPDRIKLRAGREIRLNALRQWNFYAGLLEGAPTTQMNREHVQRIVAEEQLRRGEVPYLVQPRESPIEQVAPHRAPCGLLPAIVCVGEFDSFEPTRDKNQDGSQLTIIWFQDDYAFPIDPAAREQIRAIDWDTYAHDFSW